MMLCKTIVLHLNKKLICANQADIIVGKIGRHQHFLFLSKGTIRCLPKFTCPTFFQHQSSKSAKYSQQYGRIT